ncbi:carbohydrate ABC transporter substrate-binding protein, CUT1 family [Austwickia chelonae]|uniref:Putative ABC transporter substrate-binding protein n=1 Tax=Austwickia chelonae NBRC 105200 TaxID=1184607 RepID=K6UMB7_9MICO|nr:sugar ABC transporter substrate-binding protein [Austwickia chelonae]GAB77971.1 putative ABC transporter substrate-binding protein [Austwickia chelonae NBRC 105200]SEV93353.1 carbohydrate ABC transporter substrate-binding protein, CUT1 family [Austwickia chelonae]
MRVRTLAALTALTLLAPGLAACSGSTGTSGKMESLTVWVPPLASDNQDKAMWDEIVKPFADEHKVKVDVTVVPWDSYETKYMTGVTSGKGPDVGYMYFEMLGDYISRKKVVDLDSHLSDTQKSNLIFLDKGKIREKQYALPFAVGGARVMFYNKDLLAKADAQPPTTWEEFLAVCEKLKNAGVTPFVGAWGDPSRGTLNAQFFPFLWQAGGELFNAEGTATRFDSPEAIRAATFINDLKTKGYLPAEATGTTPDTAHKEFHTGKAAFMLDTEAHAPQLKKAGLNYGFTASLKDRREGTFIATDSLVMLDKCADKKLCASLMDFLTKGPQADKFRERMHFPPIGKDAKKAYDKEFADIYTEQKDILHALPVITNGAPAYNALYKNLQQMLGGEKTPEQAMKDAAKEGNAALKK